MNNYNNSGIPEFLNEYLVHLRLVQLLSERSIQGYYEDIRMFLRYVHQDRNDIDCDIEDIDISDFPSEKLRDITVTDIYNFIFYVSDERHNSDKARYRKISSLRSFFKYLEKVAHVIDKDPTRDLDVPVPKKSLPKFLSLSESMHLTVPIQSVITALLRCFSTVECV